MSDTSSIVALGVIATALTSGFGAYLAPARKPIEPYSARHAARVDGEPVVPKYWFPRRDGAVPCSCGSPACDGWRVVYPAVWPGAG
jgi:hypothetical protein